MCGAELLNKGTGVSVLDGASCGLNMADKVVLSL